jgi:hypothetical protein
MPGQVEGGQLEALQNLRIIEETTVLAAVGAGRVQQQKRNALAGLLHVDAMRHAADGDSQVAADDGLEIRFHGAAHCEPPPLVRSSASRSLK